MAEHILEHPCWSSLKPKSLIFKKHVPRCSLWIEGASEAPVIARCCVHVVQGLLDLCQWHCSMRQVIATGVKCSQKFPIST